MITAKGIVFKEPFPNYYTAILGTYMVSFHHTSSGLYRVRVDKLSQRPGSNRQYDRTPLGGRLIEGKYNAAIYAAEQLKKEVAYYDSHLSKG